MTTEYRVAPAVAARLMGLVLVLIAVLMLLTTGAVALLDLSTAWLLVPAVLGLLVLAVGALAQQRRGWVVRCGEEGYRVQWVRGVGVDAARWRDVQDAVTATVAGSRCLVLRLHDGRTTTIPVDMIAGDPERFVGELRDHLDRGHGIRRLPSAPGS